MPISAQKDFARIYASGKKWHASGMIIYYEAAQNKRFSVIASKKVGKAVVRNRCKRLLRAAFLACCDELASGHYVFICRSGLEQIKYLEIAKSARWALRRLGCLR